MKTNARTPEYMAAHVKRALAHIDDTDRDGLQGTPERWAKMMVEMTTQSKFNMTTFKNEGCDEMVAEVGIPFHSLCEHHLVPFFGTAVVAYIPKDRIVGISKLCRSVEFFARRLQVQERMTKQVGDFLQDMLDPLGVAVMIRARHMCQEMRGIRKNGVETVTSYLTGAFREDARTREEFMAIARRER